MSTSLLAASHHVAFLLFSREQKLLLGEDRGPGCGGPAGETDRRYVSTLAGEPMFCCSSCCRPAFNLLTFPVFVQQKSGMFPP